MKPLPLKIKEYKNEEEARENGEGVDSFCRGNEWMDDNLGEVDLGGPAKDLSRSFGKAVER